jgi:outer membrane protein
MAWAAERFLDTLALVSLIDTQARFVESLEARARDAADRVELGRALEADRLRIELALARARQEALRLDLELAASRERLGTAVGLAGPVDPVPPAPPVSEPMPGIDALVERALAGRPDLAALQEAVAAQRLAARAIGAEILPRLDSLAAYRWDTATLFRDDSWLEGAIRLSWRPFAAGTRGPRREAAQEEARALDSELAEARREAEDEVRLALAALETARAAERVAARGVEQAAETARVEAERFRAGRATASDLLEAESELNRQQAERILSRIGRLRARVALALATGEIGGEPGRWLDSAVVKSGAR